MDVGDYFFPFPILLRIITQTMITKIATKIPTIPFNIISNAISIFCMFILHSPFSLQELGYNADYKASGDYGSNLSGYVGSGSLHQDDVSGLSLSSHLLNYTGGHGECGDSTDRKSVV